MDTKKILDTINKDLVANLARRVIYLEGQTDPPIFFGLLGLPQPVGGAFLHQQTLVKGLNATDASGNAAVRAYVAVAQANGFAGRVFGIVDGDGDELVTLAPLFDAPHAGPLFAWKAYSIESLLAHVPWPAQPGWGVAPDWKVELVAYTPYVAVNRLRQTLAARLETLRLHKFWHPISGQPLENTASVEAALQADKGLLTGLDVALEFGKEVTRFQAALTRSVQEGLVLLNGKWLLRHFLVSRGGHDPDHWAREWTRHAATVGGLPEVRDLWLRITGLVP